MQLRAENDTSNFCCPTAYRFSRARLGEPPSSAAVLLIMRKTGKRNDWWDWGVILLLVAGGAIILWGSVWVAHSQGAPRHLVTARTVSSAISLSDRWYAREE
jgi:hypothetical protein